MSDKIDSVNFVAISSSRSSGLRLLWLCATQRAIDALVHGWFAVSGLSAQALHLAPEGAALRLGVAEILHRLSEYGREHNAQIGSPAASMMQPLKLPPLFQCRRHCETDPGRQDESDPLG